MSNNHHAQLELQLAQLTEENQRLKNEQEQLLELLLTVINHSDQVNAVIASVPELVAGMPEELTMNPLDYFQQTFLQTLLQRKFAGKFD